MKRFAFVVMMAVSACALAQAEPVVVDRCYGKDCVVNTLSPPAGGGAQYTIGRTNVEWYAIYVQSLIQSSGNIASIAGTGTTTYLPGTVVSGTQYTAVGNVGAGEDDLQTYSLAGSTLMSAGRSILYEASGQIANNANAKTLKLYYGASAILTATLPTSIAANWISTVTVTRMGAGSTQRYVVELRVINSSTNAVANVFVAQGTLALADGSAQTIKATATATTDNDITQLTSIISYL